MKKFNIALLLLLFAGMQGLIAQSQDAGADAKAGAATVQDAGADSKTETVAAKAEATTAQDTPGIITVKINPSVEGRGRIYLGGGKAFEGENLSNDGGDVKLKVAADYNGIGGLSLEIKGGVTKSGADFNLEDAFVYAHMLQAFGFDKNILDVYLKAGRFGAGGFTNGDNVDNDSWKAQVGGLGRDNVPNMQLDVKIMDMLTVRYGVRFANFDSTGNDMDMGWGLLFEKKFGDHKIKASLGYAINLTNNEGNKPNGKAKDTVGPSQDFDKLALTAGYEGSFGIIKVAAFGGVSGSGLLHKPIFSYVNPGIDWGFGARFMLLADAGYELFGVGTDFGGKNIRKNNDYRDYAAVDGIRNVEKTDNSDFDGLAVNVWTHALEGIMGKKHLVFWAKAQFYFGQPANKDITRVTNLHYIEIAAKQIIIDAKNANVDFTVKFGMWNSAEFKTKGIDGYTDGSGNLQHRAFNPFLDLTLSASFASLYKVDVKHHKADVK